MRSVSQVAAWIIVASAMLAVGCAVDARIPANADLSVRGRGELAYTAPHDGMVYVYDQDDEQMVYSGLVRKGQAVTVNPEEHEVSIDGNAVAESGLQMDHEYRIYFEPERARTASGRVERTDIDIDAKDSKETEVTVDGDKVTIERDND